MIRTAIYMRVSSEKQAQDGDSIPAQRAALRKYIDEHDNMIFTGEYLDDGISGTKENREELQRLLSDVKEGKIDRIVVTKMDRLHRSLRNFLNMQDILDKHNCDWIAIWEPMYDTTTPQGKMIVNTMMNIAQFEAEQTGQRIRQVQAYKVSQGEVISGTTPPGLKIVGKHIVPDENAPIVKEMFEYYAFCGNMSQTMKHFDCYGIFPKTTAAFRHILQNTKYIGVLRDNENFCEPIISIELFEDVQRKLNMNVKVSQKRTYIFSGLIRCAECGRVLTGGIYKKTRNGKEYRAKQYRCPGRYSSGIRRCENTKHIREKTIEDLLLSNVRNDLKNAIITAEAEEPPKNQTRRKKALEKKVERLKELYLNGLISIDEYKADKESLIAEIASLQPHTAPDLPQSREILSMPFEQLYDGFTDEEKLFFWRAVIKSITLDKYRNISYIFL